MASECNARESRAALDGLVRYCAGGETGVARWVNLSRTGGGLRLGRYLRPGRQITLYLPAAGAEGYLVAMEARLAWCRRGEVTGEFVAGLQLLRNEPLSALSAAVLLQQARAAKKPDSGSVETQTWFGCPQSGTRLAV